MPAFEETFYIATQIERLSRFTKVFASPFSVLAGLHDKGAFQRLLTRLGLPVPETVLATSDDELREAAGRLGSYFARAAFSRGGICCLTNAGPLAGHGRSPPHAGITLAGAAVHRRRDGLHLQHRPRGAGELPPDARWSS